MRAGGEPRGAERWGLGGAHTEESGGVLFPKWPQGEYSP
jgi:hypothetical protein